jgi:hypothetical protein
MFTVAILINGNPIFARTAVNQAKRNDKGQTMYRLDTGQIVWHDRDAGPIELAKQLLDTIDRGSTGDRPPDETI